MKLLFGSVFLAFGLAGAALPARAAVTDLGDFASSTALPVFFSGSSQTSISDEFKFSLQAPATVSFDLLGVFAPSFQGSISLYNSSGSLVSGPSGFVTVSPSPFSLASLSADEGIGSYSLKVAGNGAGGYFGELNVAVAAVPLPASLPMFGAALVALSLLGFGLKNRSTAATGLGVQSA